MAANYLQPFTEAKIDTRDGRIESIWMLNALPLAAGQQLELVLEFRAIEDASGSSQAGFNVLAGTWRKEDPQPVSVLARPVIVGSGWETIRLPITLARDFAAGDFRVRLGRAYFEVATEWRRIELVERSGDAAAAPRAYPGQEPDAAWRAAADARIHVLRMSPLTVRVVDAAGRPVEGATVSVEMQRHAYPFGTCVVARRILDTEDPDSAIYRGKLQRYFNYIVTENDLKWPHWAGERGSTPQADVLRSLQWHRDAGLRVKGHTLVWASWQNTPRFLRAFEHDPEQLQARILEHIRDIGAAAGPWVQDFDVLNEPMVHKEIIEILGMDAVADWFREARRVMPHARLIINDYDILGNYGDDKKIDGYLAFIKDLMARGAPIDAIGFQSHFWGDRLTPPERMLQIIDRFAALGLPLMVTEFDMNMPDEQLQAQYTADFLRVWFSHPATVSYIMWGFWAKAHWMKEAGAMFRDDWSEKPNLKAYTDVVLGEWWTREHGATGADGQFTARGFHGRHRLAVEHAGYRSTERVIDLAPGGAEITVVLHPLQ